MAIEKINIPKKVDSVSKKRLLASGEIGKNETVLADEINQIAQTTNKLVEAFNQNAPITGFNFKENLPTYADLATVENPQLNDGYGVIADGLIYVFNGDSFPTEGNGMDLGLKPNGTVAENEVLAVAGLEVFKAIKPINSVINKTIQLFDKETADIEVCGLSSDGKINSNNNFVLKIRLESNKTYSFHSDFLTPNNQPKVLFFNENDEFIGIVDTVDEQYDYTFTTPDNTAYSLIHLGFFLDAIHEDLRDNAVVNSLMLNEGNSVLPYQSFGVTTVMTDALDKKIIVKTPKKNLLDVSLTDFSLMYSPGSKILRANTGEEYVATVLIPVKNGEWYAWNGSNTGGFFANENDTNAVDNISFVMPVDGLGWCFQVPLNSNIKFVALNMVRVGTSGNVLSDDYQLELGEKITEFQPYELVELFNPEYLPKSTNDTVDTGMLQKLTDVDLVTKVKHNYLPNFFKACKLKNKDVNVVMVGTSLTARSIEHCSEHPKANERPPLMHSKNMASILWDALKWDSQFYRRYDFSNFFTETGNWNLDSNVANWDDGAYRSGLTKYSDDNSSTVGFQIPANAWQFNLIMRTDSLGTENAVLNIAEGNGKIQVFNDTTQSWVEANGFVFSQKQIVQTLPSVTIPDAQDEIDYTINNFQIGGNTTYQKRLKMRCKGVGFDSRNTVKNITVSRTTGRLMYWGVEWSVREFMITLINSARGSYGMRLKDDVFGLTGKQENEVWSFKPDLIMTENPIHNSGASREPNVNFPTNYWGKITEDFFFGDNPVSFKSRATDNGLNPEYLIYTSSITDQFFGINDDGTLKIGTDKNGKSYTALESFSMADQFLKENYPEVLAINSVNYWVEVGNKAYGNLKIATEASSKVGATLTNDGGHWNDLGSKVIAKTIVPYLNFE